ncbi:hypothetical protein [Hydrogenobacter hydrogenophilus]|uniref:Uncharacterized protein n=1 Tax=Hydrogenobacter hydrogenophilus TaxID=35835 RepID=A0A285NPX1_9AQUI|nr:hypothetical protein [Hydrogenobacter hydrogenophilus]SNZ11499.1 hypothetical protein SAMN06265353_0255 [Hydrogenobacter hydrogenophilus]
MRFFISANIKSNRPLYYLILTFLLFLLFYWISSWIYFYHKYGFTYSSSFKYFFGDPNFPERISLSQLSEDMHVDVFLKAFYILVLFSLFLLSSFSEKLKTTLIIGTTFSGIFAVLSDLLIVYASPLFIYVKLFSFFMFQILSGVVLLLTLLFFIFMGEDKASGISSIKLLLLMFSFFLLVFACINFMVFFSKMGFTFDNVKDYYLGNPSTFSKPKTFEGMLKVFHPHLLSMAIYSITVSHLLLFTNSKKKLLIGLSLFFFSFLDNLSGFLIRFVHPQMAIVKVFAFLLLQCLLFYTSLLLFRSSKA